MTGSWGNTFMRKGVLSVVRKTLPALKASMLREFELICEELNFHPSRRYDEFSFQGRTVEWFSIDDSTKVKSRQRDILVVNELTELEPADYTELCIRTKYKIVCDYNPDFGSWVKDAEESKTVFSYSYLTNPLLTPQQVAAVEDLKKDSFLWQSLGLGEYIAPQGLVLPKFELYDVLPFTVEKFGKVHGGIDFGFANDPTAITICTIDKDQIFAREILYAPQINNKEIAGYLVEYPDILFYCDHEPRTINELKNLGATNVTRATKGKGSINAALQIMRGKQIFIHKDSKNLIREFRSYTYHKDTSVPIDKNNHAIDSLRMIINSTQQAITQTGVTIPGKYETHFDHRERIYKRF